MFGIGQFYTYPSGLPFTNMDLFQTWHGQVIASIINCGMEWPINNPFLNLTEISYPLLNFNSAS